MENVFQKQQDNVQTKQNQLTENAGPMTSQSPPGFQLKASPIQKKDDEGDTEPSNIDKLTKLLTDDDSSGAISLMKSLSPSEVDTVLGSTTLRDLAYSAFGNADMAKAMTAMKGDALKSLQWMFGEGVNWEQAKTFLAVAKNKTAIYTNTAMRAEFVGLCGNTEMAEAVDILGGTLRQKLEWMAAEGSSWDLIKEKIDACTDPNQKLALYNSSTVRALFTSERTNEQIAEAVDLLGGTLLQKLKWMKSEGSSWTLVSAKILACTVPSEKTALYASSDMKTFFVNMCTNETIKLAVNMLGGTLNQKLGWMAAEGTNIDLVGDVIRNTAQSELAPVVADTTLLDSLKAELSSSGYTTMLDMLKNDLLMQEDFTNTVDTGWSTTANMRHTRSEIKISKAVNWEEEGTFASGGFAAMKIKGNNAVGTYLDNKFKIKIEAMASGASSPADGLYPIRVSTTESTSGLDIELVGGQSGRSNATKYYEQGQGSETTLPDIVFGHELAHSVLGLSDEYTDPAYPSRIVKTDNSLMGNFYSEGISSAGLKPRHFDWLVSNIKKYYPDRKITVVP